MFPSYAGFQIGLVPTYNMTSVLFFIIGMVFGQSYAMNFIKPLLWVHTGWLKKITRAIIGSLIAIGVYVGFYFLGKNNKSQSQKYIF